MPHRCLPQIENTVIRLIQLRPIEKGQHRSEIHWPGFKVLEFQIERIHFCKSISLYQKSGYGFTREERKISFKIENPCLDSSKGTHP